MNTSAIVLGLLILLGMSSLISISIINRYLSIKKNYQKCLGVMCVLVVNMICLLNITYMLPVDIWVHKFDVQEIDLEKYQRICALFDFTWLSVYWFQFLLCWFVIPIMLSYMELKYFAPMQYDPTTTMTVTNLSKKSTFIFKLKKAILVNLKFYGFALLGLIVSIIYLKTLTKSKIEIKPLLISLTHLYSITYTLILLAYGLNTLPFTMLQKMGGLSSIFHKKQQQFGGGGGGSANVVTPPKKLNEENRMYMKLSKCNDDMNECKIGIVENYSLIMNPNNLSEYTSDIHVQELFQNCKREVESIFIVIKNENELNSSRMDFTNVLRNSTLNADASSCLQSLDELNLCYNKFITEYYNFLYAKEGREATLKALIAYKNQAANASAWFTFKSVIRHCMGLVFLCLSLIVAYVEIVPVRFHSMVLSAESNTLLLQSMVLFMYLTVCCLFSLSKFKISNFHLIGKGNSNPRNTLYYSLYSSRLLTPLGFNFSSLIRANATQSFTSSFQKKLYQELYPLVLKLNNVLPPIIITTITISYWFNLKDRLLIRLIGSENYYQLFGNITQLATDVSDFTLENNSDLNQDIEYAIQEGRNVYEKYINNYL